MIIFLFSSSNMSFCFDMKGIQNNVKQRMKQSTLTWILLSRCTKFLKKSFAYTSIASFCSDKCRKHAQKRISSSTSRKTNRYDANRKTIAFAFLNFLVHLIHDLWMNFTLRFKCSIIMTILAKTMVKTNTELMIGHFYLSSFFLSITLLFLNSGNVFSH